MKTPNPLLSIDFYKSDHRRQYPEGTTRVYSNFTPRSDRLYKGHLDKVVVFGIQMFIKDYLMDAWNEGFFERPLPVVLEEYKAFMDSCLGPDAIPVKHILDLHNLGYLPIEIKALPEGSLAPMRVPVLTITNTHDDFFWLVNYIETVMSTELWKPMTNATIAYEYRSVFEKFADETGAPMEAVVFQGHDFSARGLSNREDGYKSGIGHLTSFGGTDTCLAIQGAKDFYNADYTKELVGTSVPATEHSVMTSNIANIKISLDVAGKWVTPGNKVLDIEMLQYDETHTNTQRLAEIAYIWYLVTELYPTGIVSIVADSFDFWYLMEYGVKVLKPVIEAREPNALGLAKVVFRPDSGNPVDVICGVDHSSAVSCYEELRDGELPNTKVYGSSFTITKGEYYGAIEALWDTFGGTVNEKGYKELNPKVGLIYGDSITLERQDQILSRLADKKFTSSNIVLGIGSYTYQYSTRDTFGFAMKATYAVINGKGVEIYKDPATDSGTKKSAKGLLFVKKDQPDGDYYLIDQVSPEREASANNCLELVFSNGLLTKDFSLARIRETLWQ